MQRSSWYSREQKRPRRIRQRYLGLLASMLLLTACVFDPNPPGKPAPPPPGERNLKPPMQAVAEVPLVGDTHALFVHQNTAYVCSNTDAGHGDTKYYHLSAIDLTTHKQRWVAKENLCFFDADDTNVYIVREDKTTYNRLVLEVRDVATGVLKAQSAFGDRLRHPLTLKGPGRPIHDTPAADLARQADGIKVVGKYVLFFNYLRVWVLDARTAKVIHERGRGKSLGTAPDIFFATLKGDILYTVEAEATATIRGTTTQPASNAQPLTVFRSVLRAIDLRTGKIAWEKKDLPPKIDRATIAIQGKGLFVQTSSPVPTQQPSDFHYRFHAGRYNKYHNSAVHYYVDPKTGEALWQKPWVMKGIGERKPFPPAQLLHLTDTHAYVKAGYKLFSISLSARKLLWEATAGSNQLNRVDVIRKNQFAFKLEGATRILNAETGNVISIWRETFLPPPPQLAGPTTSGADPTKGKTFVASHNCLRADGSVRTGAPAPGTRPYYEDARVRGFFAGFCTRNRIEIAGITYDKQTTWGEERILWRSLTTITQGTPELFFRHGSRIYAIANKFTLLSFNLGH